MIRRPYVIAVYEPRWFMKVLDILNNRGIPYSIYDEELPYHSILYTDYYYYVEQVRDRTDIEIYYDPIHDCRVLEKSILATRYKDRYNEVIVGIDPGLYPYLVIIGDDELLDHRPIDVGGLSKYLSYKLACYPAVKKIIRVGRGYNGWNIVLELRDKLDTVIEVVDEVETTPKGRRLDDIVSIEKYLSRLDKYSRCKDIYAALKIALRKGLEVV